MAVGSSGSGMARADWLGSMSRSVCEEKRSSCFMCFEVRSLKSEFLLRCVLPILSRRLSAGSCTLSYVHSNSVIYIILVNAWLRKLGKIINAPFSTENVLKSRVDSVSL